MFKKLMILLVTVFIGFLAWNALEPHIVKNGFKNDKNDGSPVETNVGTTFMVSPEIQNKLLKNLEKEFNNDNEDYFDYAGMYLGGGFGSINSSDYPVNKQINEILNYDLSPKDYMTFSGYLPVFAEIDSKFLYEEIIVEDAENEYYKRAAEYLSLYSLFEQGNVDWIEANTKMMEATDDNISFQASLYFDSQEPRFQDIAINSLKKQFKLQPSANPFYQRYNLGNAGNSDGGKSYGSSYIDFSDYASETVSNRFNTIKKNKNNYIRENYSYHPDNNYLDEAENKIVYYYPIAVEKINANSYMVTLNVSDPIDSGAYYTIVKNITRKVRYQDDENLSDYNLFINIVNTEVTNGEFVENSIYNANITIYYEDGYKEQRYLNYPFRTGWYPNEYASSIVKSYFMKMKTIIENEVPFNPEAVFEEIATEKGITKQEVGSYVLNYIVNFRNIGEYMS